MKACSTCKETKPGSAFARDKRRADGLASQCRSCRREVARRWRERNPDANRRYYHENREPILAQQKAWRIANPELARQKSRRNNARNGANWTEYKRNYRRRNRERVDTAIREWHAAHPEKMRAYKRKSEAKRRARKRGTQTEDIDPMLVFARDDGTCGICGIVVSPDDWHLDHIVPLAVGGPHTYENVQVAHPGCNLSKGHRVAAWSHHLSHHAPASPAQHQE